MVWAKLQDGPRFMKAEFLAKFQTEGFGFVKGSKWSSQVEKDEYTEKAR